MGNYINLYALYTPEDIAKIPELKTFQVRRNVSGTGLIATQSLPISPGVTTTLLEITYLDMDRELCHGRIFYTLDKRTLLSHWHQVLRNHYEVANQLRELYIQETTHIEQMEISYNAAYKRAHE